MNPSQKIYVELLNLFRKISVNLTEIARETGIPRSSTSRDYKKFLANTAVEDIKPLGRPDHGPIN